MDARLAPLVRRSIVAACLAIVAVVWAGSSDALGGWTSGAVGGTGNSVGSGMLAVTHDYGGTTCSAALTATPGLAACSGSLLPTSSAGSRTDTVTNTGTTTAAATSASVQVPGCGAVALANTGNASSVAGPMLARSGTTFNPSAGPFAGAGSITLDGSGYESAVNLRQEPGAPPALALGTQNYGYGIWFKTGATSTGALFGTVSAGNDSGTADRVLYLTATGQLAFSFTTTASVSVVTSSLPYNDNTWHFAFVMMAATRTLGGVSSVVTLWVDGVSTGSATVGTLAAASGYWHVGWAPVAGTGRYFTGSLSGFTIDTDGAITVPVGKPTAYTAGNELWRFDDTGGAYDGSAVSGVFTGSSVFGSGDPCAAVSVSWPALRFTGTLRALVSAGTQSIAFSDPAASTAATVTLSSTVTPTVLKRLLIYAPIRADYRVGSSWTLALAWSTATSVLV